MLQEEQRKVSNMNDCRDTWAELMRTAAQQQAGQLKPFVSRHSQPSSTDLAGLPYIPRRLFCLPTSGMSFTPLCCLSVHCQLLGSATAA